MAGEDFMTRIPLSPAHMTFHDSSHDYGDVFVQGGRNGMVLNRADGSSYRTAFVECSPKGSFIRGEGDTLQTADDNCWAKLQAYLGCAQHVWEARQYRNGGGFCRTCNQFGSGVFTAEQLDLFCTQCQEPTFHTLGGRNNTEPRCEDHDPTWLYFKASLKAMFECDPDAEDGNLIQSMYRRLDDVYRGRTQGADPEALEWALARYDLSD